MSADQMRKWVADQYPNKTWREKVARKSDEEIKAIYLRMRNDRRYST